MRRNFLCLLTSAAVLSLVLCTTTRFVSDGSCLLDEVKIRTDQKNIRPPSLCMYVRQNPSVKWFGLIKTQFYVYNLLGYDSTKWGNKFLRRIGDVSVIYSEDEAKRSEEKITKAVHNMGYMTATVRRSIKVKKKKIKLYYDVTTGKPYVAQLIKYDIYDPKIASLLKQDSARSSLEEGMYLDMNVLDADRQRITNKLLRNGYYKFNKDYIGYTADTVRNTYNVDLAQHLQMCKAYASDSARAHQQYWINKINSIMDYDVLRSSVLSSVDINDSVHHKGYLIYYKDKLCLRPKVSTDNLRFVSGDSFSERDVQQTYSSPGRLPTLKYTDTRFIETQVGDSTMLDRYVMLTKSKHRSAPFEVEGINSVGDSGAAASVSFQNRNLSRGPETFMIKLRGAYEAISGLQAGYSNNNYTEYGVETSISFPNFLFPFISSDFKRKIRATTESGLRYNYQSRPEFLRTMTSANQSYKWTQRQKIQHRIDSIDIAFLYLPRILERFKEDYINKGQNHTLQYSYQDRLIVNMGYSYNYNSVGGSIINNTIAPNSYSVRFNFGSVGNVMYALPKAANIRGNSNGEYTILGIPYAQYLKEEFDFTKNIRIGYRNSLAFYTGAGIAVPYGNVKTIPFEKQYFSGGADSVRGRGIRDLGPGPFTGNGNLFNQSGDIGLDANIEYRNKLFRKFQGAIFTDAGNIWTIRSYANQPGRVFKSDRFYKQTAAAYGLGLRLDLDFLILRFNGGMKAVSPAYETRKEHFPIIHPKFSRDFVSHSAVGYPF